MGELIESLEQETRELYSIIGKSVTTAKNLWRLFFNLHFEICILHS
jgi:hypothetical protein